MNKGVVDKARAMARAGKVLVQWDTCELADVEAKYRFENKKDFGLNGETEDEIRNSLYEDQDFWGFAWDDVLEQLTQILKERNPSGYWLAEVNGFGWQKLDGQKKFKAENGKEFLEEVLPKADCTFKIRAYGKQGLHIWNAHHDAPTGEDYYLQPAPKDVELDERHESKKPMVKGAWRPYNVERIVKNVETVFKKGSIEHLSKEAYEFITLSMGFIAHYNLYGFMDVYKDLKEFAERLQTSEYSQDRGYNTNWANRSERDSQFLRDYGAAYCTSKSETIRRIVEVARQYENK